MKVLVDGFTLSSGREIDVHGGILGIGQHSVGAHAGKITISGGWDDGIECDDFTYQERLEIAVYVMNLWLKWVEEA